MYSGVFRRIVPYKLTDVSEVPSVSIISSIPVTKQ
jgi:hypothetical protein